MTSRNQATRRTVRLGVALTACAIAISGCMEQPITRPVQPEYFTASTQAQTDLFFQPGSSHLANGEVARLRSFLAGLALQPTDDVIVDVPSSGSPTVDVRRYATARNAVGNVPARVRLEARPGFATTEPRPDAGFVQVIRYDKLRVDCENSGKTAFDIEYRTPIPPIGCSNALNLANMAAERRDLVAPRELQPMDARSSVRAMERYNTGQLKPPPFALDAVSD